LALFGLLLAAVTWLVTVLFLQLVDGSQPAWARFPAGPTYSQLVWLFRSLLLGGYSFYFFFRQAVAPALGAYRLERAGGTVPPAIAYLRAFHRSSDFRTLVTWTSTYVFLLVLLRAGLVTAVLGELLFIHLPLFLAVWLEERSLGGELTELAMRHSLSQADAKKIALLAGAATGAVLAANEVVNDHHRRALERQQRLFDQEQRLFDQEERRQQRLLEEEQRRQQQQTDRQRLELEERRWKEELQKQRQPPPRSGWF